MKTIAITSFVVIVVVGGIFMLAGSSSSGSSVGTADNVRVIDGKQIIEIQAHGGYQPNKSLAKAGLPTVIRFVTSGTFDCSASVRISAIHVSKLLPSTGSTDIDIGTSTVTTLRGSCGMGMYPFQVEFQG